MTRLTVEFAYPMTWVPRRGKAERTLWIKDRVEVEVRDVSATEAPLGLSMTPSHIALARGHASGIDRYAIDGTAFAAPKAPEGTFLDSTAATWCLFAMPMAVGEGAGFVQAPWASVKPSGMLAERPTGLGALVRDGHDEVRDKVVAAARRTVLREGRLLHPSDLPCLSIHSYYSTSSLSCVWRSGQFHGGYEFRLDDHEGMRAIAAIAVEAGYRMEGEDLPRIGYEGDLDRFSWDARKSGAREAALQLRHAAGRAAAKMGPGTFRGLAKVVELCGAVEADATRGADLTAALKEFDRSLDGGARAIVLKDLRLAEAALESAETHVHVPSLVEGRISP